MNKIRNIDNYIETVKQNEDFFKSYYYHSLIDLNLVKLDLILKHGILCKNLIEQNKLVTLYTHSADNFESKNGNKYVSLTEYTDKCKFNNIFESFACHTLTSLSLMVNKDIEVSRVGERQTYFDDELFCLNYISKNMIRGIILPEHLANLQIKEVSCLPNDISCYTNKYIKNWIECMQNYFKKSISVKEIENSLIQYWNILNEYENPERWTESAMKTQRNLYGYDFKDVLANILNNLWQEKLNILNPTYLDVVKELNNEELPIYEIKQKCLKKIN